MMSAMLALLVVGSPANNVTVHAKKHTECFNSVVSDGKDHPFDAPDSIAVTRIIRMGF